MTGTSIKRWLFLLRNVVWQVKTAIQAQKEYISIPNLTAEGTNALVSTVGASVDPGVSTDQLKAATNLAALQSLVQASNLSDDLKAYVGQLQGSDWSKIHAEIAAHVKVSAEKDAIIARLNDQLRAATERPEAGT